MNRDILSSHLNGNPLPEYPTSRAIHIRHINQCWNWTKGESRDRIYTECELNLIFTTRRLFLSSVVNLDGES